MKQQEEEMKQQEEEMKQQEEMNQEEELNTQEEHIRKSIDEEEVDEEENIKVKDKKKSLINKYVFKPTIGNNNDINPGVGISSSSSPVNIYINGEKTSVDKFRNKPNKHNNKPSDNSNNSSNNNCNDNYYKQASRIYNNCDWINSDDDWTNNDKYNYDKRPSCDNSINKIPQTLNESINSKKNRNNSEPCPLEINKPWSNYKTGDDKEKNELIPEGFNF